MDKIYYSPQGYWKGITAIKKLSEAANVSESKAKDWLSRQAIWQIYLPAPKKIIRPKFENYIPNDTHQIDLLYLPYDKIGKKKYKYALTIVDLATRYKDAEPLTERSTNAVAIALSKIYNRRLTFPRLIQCDDGAEFKGKVNQLFLKHHVLVKRGIPGNHRSQAIVESFNKQLAERLFSYQYDREMITDRTNTEWVRRLPKVINVMNNEVSKVTGLKPVDAIKEKTLTRTENKKVKPDTSIFNKKVRYLYAPGEVEGGDRKRATDPIWSTRIYEVESILETNPPVYYLRKPGPQRAFVKEELQIVPH